MTTNEAREAVRRYRLTIPDERLEAFDRATPYHQHLLARDAGYLTQAQFEAATKQAGDLWHYTGD